jgi:hypothetical protein
VAVLGGLLLVVVVAVSDVGPFFDRNPLEAFGPGAGLRAAHSDLPHDRARGCIAVGLALWIAATDVGRDSRAVNTSIG